MPIQLSLGGADFTPLLKGDLSTFLKDNLDHIVQFNPSTLLVLGRPVSDLAGGSFSGSFQFSTSPSWTIAQVLPINISVSAGVTCTISLLKPGDTLFSYYAGPDADDLEETPLPAADGRYYIVLGLNCSLSLGASGSFSSGNFGVSGSISSQDQFTIRNGCWVTGSTSLEQAILQAFSSFVLPFQSDSIEGLADGGFLDFDFIGKLQLGFGATYGFSGLFLAGLSNGEVSAAFSSPLGKSVLSAAPSYSVGASFKLTYSHDDVFRVVVVRTRSASFNGATLYLLRQDRSGIQTQEQFGISVSLGAKFQTDSGALQAETQAAANKILGSTAGGILGGKLSSIIASAVDDVNNSVNSLLAKADNLSVLAIEAEQSSTRENTALFVFTFDFAQAGAAGYNFAMNGDYAAALQQAGVSVGAGSFVEQLYVKHSGLSLQLFHLAAFSSMTDYIQKSQVFYVDEGRSLQIRDVIGFKSVSSVFGKQREADLYFIAEATMPSSHASLSGVSVSMVVSFIDTNDAAAYRETESFLAQLNLAAAASGVQRYTNAHPHGSVTITLEADAALLSQIPVTAYQANGKPAPEPHAADAQNYAALVQAVKMVVGQPDQYATLFESEFGDYADWLEFNRTKTDQPGSTRPGDRLSEGNAVVSLWPEGYAPSDETGRTFVQVYLYAVQQGMNFFASVKQLAASTAAVTNADQLDQLLRSISGMFRSEVPFPTYFLKPVVAALVLRAGLTVQPATLLPDPITSANFSLTLAASRPATFAQAG